MILTRSDYEYYLAADRKAMNIGSSIVKNLLHERWRYVKILRKLELLINTSSPRIFVFYYQYRLRKLGVLLGYSIPPNVFGPGISLPHYGDIVVNPFAKIGANCRIHVGVNIGTQIGTDKVPVIGNNCYIGPGAKLFGDIVIGDNVVIGANAVVNKSFVEGNCTIAGVPAKIISPVSSHGLYVKGCDELS